MNRDKIKTALRRFFTKENLKKEAKRWGSFLLNPRLLLCLGIAWFITNGWSYVFFAVGMMMKINWMRIVGGAYMSMLWLPFTPEKVITVLIAIILLRIFFPGDQKTLGVLRREFRKLRKKNA